MFDGERLPLVVGGDQGVLGEKNVKRDIGRPAVIVAVGNGETGPWLECAGVFEERARGDAFPKIVEAGPARDAMEVAEDLHPRKGQELVP